MSSSLSRKAIRVTRVWWLAILAWRGLANRPLPEFVRSWSDEVEGVEAREPSQWSRTVDRALKVGSWRPRCIIRAMVLYRLLAENGNDPVLVIGIGDSALSKDAHAWVELDGREMGPWPGSGGMPRLASFDRGGTW